jgi:hypothetical protein
MTQIVIHLQRGPDEQPVGRLTTEAGDVIAFTGWLHLIRLLEDELRKAPRATDASLRESGPGR